MICTAYKSVSLLIYATIAPNAETFGTIGCIASHINAPAERPAATDHCSGHVASPPVRLQPIVSGRCLGVWQEPCPFHFPFAKADLFFEAHPAHIDLSLSGGAPHRSNRPFCLRRAPGSLDTTNAFHDDSTG